jgi:membrane dipeptidase
VPVGAAARWPPFAAGVTIDTADRAAAVNLVWPDDTDPAEVAGGVVKELAAARASGLSAVVTTVAPSGRFWLDDAVFEKTRREIAAWKARIAEHPDALLLVEPAADLETARRDRRLGMVFTFQGTEPLGEDADRIPMFRELGVRVIQLTHNRRNLGDGCMEPGNAGLSNYGHTVVERLNAARVIVDLAHGAQRTIREGIASPAAARPTSTCSSPISTSRTATRSSAPC